jgi:hypothetical protein
MRWGSQAGVALGLAEPWPDEADGLAADDAGWLAPAVPVAEALGLAAAAKDC